MLQRRGVRLMLLSHSYGRYVFGWWSNVLSGVLHFCGSASHVSSWGCVLLWGWVVEHVFNLCSSLWQQYYNYGFIKIIDLLSEISLFIDWIVEVFILWILGSYPFFIWNRGLPFIYGISSGEKAGLRLTFFRELARILVRVVSSLVLIACSLLDEVYLFY